MHLNNGTHKRNYYDIAIVLLAVIYIFVSCGLSGLPDVSRLSFISAAAMAALLLLRKQSLNVPPWLLLIVALYLYLIIPCLALPAIAWETITGTTTAFIGTVCISLVLANNLIDSKYVAYTMLGAALTNVIAVCLGIDTTPLEYGGFNESRVSGLLGNANVLAISLSLSSIVIWLIPGIPRSVRLLSLFTAVYGITVTGSRKGVILCVALLLIVVKRLSNDLSRNKQIAILGSLPIVLAVFYQYIDDVLYMLSDNVLAINRFTQIFSGKDSSYSEREWLIDTGYQIWLKAPLFGEGLGQFEFISGFGAYSHNNYIELLVSGGIIALFLYYTLYVLIIFYAYKFQRNELFYAALVVTTLLVVDTAMVSFVGRSTMLFIAFALVHFSRKTENDTAGQLL